MQIQRQNEAKRQAMIEKERAANEAKQRNEYLKKIKQNDILERINENNEKINNYLEQKNRQQAMKVQRNALIETEKEVNKKREEQRRQYELEERRLELKEKENRIKEFKEQKEKEAQEKKRLIKEKEKQKEKIKQKFDAFFKKNGATVDIEQIKQMFSDDKELQDHLDKLKNDFEEQSKKDIEKHNRSKQLLRAQSAQRKKMIKEKTIKAESKEASQVPKKEETIHKKKESENRIKRPVTSKENKDLSQESGEGYKRKNKEVILPEHPAISKKEKMTEEKAKNLVDEYRNKLMRDFLLFCEKQKKENQNRDKLFNEEKDEVAKRRLAKILAMQRAQSSDKIAEYNKMIDVKLEEYKTELEKQIQQ